MAPPEPQDLNPYRPPTAEVHDDYGEQHIRRDGARLVVPLAGGLHSVCAHCASTRDLEPRSVTQVWRNPVGCLSTIVLAVIVVAAALSAEHVGIPDPVMGWLVAVAAILVFVVNIVWRSRRVELSYSLCLDCRARRGRWLILWALIFAAVVGAAFAFEQGLLIALLPLYVVAERLQPAALRPARLKRNRVWVRGMRPRVLERFPPLD